MKRIEIAFAAILLSGCATEPAAPPEVPAATTAAVSIPPGYRLVERDGVRLLCSRATETGSRFNRETCMTEAQYAEMQARGQDVWQGGLRNSVNTCGGTGTAACRQ